MAVPSLYFYLQLSFNLARNMQEFENSILLSHDRGIYRAASCLHKCSTL